MNNKQTLKLLILITTALTGAVKAYGYAEAEQSLQTDVQPAVAIEKLSSSKETGTVNPETGAHDGLSSVFSIQTNGSDEDYDFMLSLTKDARLHSSENALGKEIMNIIDEETAMYFAGEKSLEETQKLIQRRVNIYVSERS